MSFDRFTATVTLPTANFFMIAIVFILQTTCEKQLKNKDLFQLLLSEISVHAHYTELFRACGQTDHHNRECGWKDTIHSVAAGRQREI